LSNASAVAALPITVTASEGDIASAASNARRVLPARRTNRKINRVHAVADSAEGRRKANSLTPNAATLAACNQ